MSLRSSAFSEMWKPQQPSARLEYLHHCSRTYVDKPLIAVHFKRISEDFKPPAALNKPRCSEGIPNCQYCRRDSPLEEDMAVFELQDKQSMGEKLDQLLKAKEVRWAGPIIHKEVDESQATENGAVSIWTYLTHEMVVVIRPPADEEDVLRRARKLGYVKRREIPYGGAGTTYHLRAKKHPGFGILTHAKELSAIHGVIAEPNLAASSGVDGPPTLAESSKDKVKEEPNNKGRSKVDTAGSLSAGGSPLPRDHWDRKAIGTDVAWQKLTGPDPMECLKRVEVAVVDGSFYLARKDAPNDTLGSYELIDFRTFKKRRKTSGIPGPFDKSAPGHGLRAAGVVAASGSKLKGVAPGCHTRLVVYPVTEVDVLDMYVWLAGLDPKSPRRRFPEPRPGVDVVTTSVGFGFARQIPISVLAHEAFNYIAKNGSAGKGTLLFFSAGNSGATAYEERPWCTAEANIGVAASTLDPKSDQPILASYSNRFGAELCAPSSSVLGRALTKDCRRIKSIGSKDFGGTSSATPLAAGVAALIRAVRPEMTHQEVRTILRTSAKRIDGEAEDRDVCWRDAANAPAMKPADRVYSNTYGFGQVHAGNAVQEALSFDSESSEANPMKEMRKPIKAKVASQGDGRGLESVSLILALNQFLLTALISIWPAKARDRLAAVMAFLGLHHLIVWTVLRKRCPPRSDDPDERDSVLEEPASLPSVPPPPNPPT